MSASAAPQPEPDHRDLLGRLKASYISSSLTILSIIQGVALAALAGNVAANYTRFTLAQFLMVAVTFGALVVVWNQISIDTMTWVQVPDFQGALIPFLVGALELFLAAAISVPMAFWLFGLAALAGFSSLGLAYVYRLAGHEPENAPLLARVRGMRGSAQVYNLTGIVVFITLGIASGEGTFQTMDADIGVHGAAASLAAIIPGLWLAGWLWRSAWYWRKIVAYARTGK